MIEKMGEKKRIQKWEREGGKNILTIGSNFKKEKEIEKKKLFNHKTITIRWWFVGGKIKLEGEEGERGGGRKIEKGEEEKEGRRKRRKSI